MVLSHIQASGNEGERDSGPSSRSNPHSRYLDQAPQGEDRATPDGHRSLPKVTYAEATHQIDQSRKGMYLSGLFPYFPLTN